MANQAADLLTSDLGMYGLGLPIATVFFSSVAMGAGAGPIGAAALGVFGGAVTIGAIKGLFGNETPGMTAKELRGAAVAAGVATAVTWIGGSMMNITQAQAFMRAADQTATQAAAGAGNATGKTLGGITGFLVYLFSLFMGGIAIAELTADFVKGLVKG